MAVNNVPRYAVYRLWLSLGLMACGVLFYGCLMHNPPQPHITDFDKVEHFTGYLILGCWFGALMRPRYLRVFIGLTLFGAFIEVVQWWSGYRDGDWHDLLADSLGAAAGLVLVRLGAMQWLAYIDARVAATRNRPG